MTYVLTLIVKADNRNDALLEAQSTIDDLFEVGLLDADAYLVEISEDPYPTICGIDSTHDFIGDLRDAQDVRIFQKSHHVTQIITLLDNMGISSGYEIQLSEEDPNGEWGLIGHHMHELSNLMMRSFSVDCSIYHADENTAGVSEEEMEEFERDPSGWSLVHLKIT